MKSFKTRLQFSMKAAQYIPSKQAQTQKKKLKIKNTEVNK